MAAYTLVVGADQTYPAVYSAKVMVSTPADHDQHMCQALADVFCTEVIQALGSRIATCYLENLSSIFGGRRGARCRMTRFLVLTRV
jgi:hypothetical protein